MVHQRQHAQRGGVAGGPDRHGLGVGQRVGAMNEPVAIDARLLRIAAVVPLADAPAIEDDAIAGLEVGMF